MGPKNTFYISVLATQIHCGRGLGVYFNVKVESETPRTRGILKKSSIWVSHFARKKGEQSRGE